MVEWVDHRFPNHPHPYDKLLVEIDAVEGTEPSQDELAALRSFLERATDKPGGIVIRVDNLIPRELARRRGPDALALEYLNGPTDDHTAFLYILCYRSRLAGLGVAPDHPQFTYFPYPCAIFIDRSYGFPWSLVHAGEWRRAVLLHETGHALGLARSTEHSQLGHCTDETCLMAPYITFRWRRFLTFRQPWEVHPLCVNCQRDLEAYKREPPKPTERLWRGYFLHENPGYQILTLPGFAYVHFGGVTDLPKAAIDEKRRIAITEMNASGTWFTATTNSFEPAEHAEAMALFTQEKNEKLRDLAKGLLDKTVAQAESLLASDPNAARALTAAELIAAAGKFPEIQTRLKAVRQKLDELAGRSGL